MNNSSEERSTGESFQDPDNGFTIWKGHPTASFIATMLVVLLIATCIITTAFVISSSHEGALSEFYILGVYGKAANYPLDVYAANYPKDSNLYEEVQVKMVIANHEYSRQVYSVDITAGGSLIDTVGPIMLENNQKWEQLVAFRPVSKGEGQNVEFVLSRQFQLSRELNKPLILQMTLNVK